ncbi:DUF1993 family protein [Synechococcus sp. A15-60]|uniref:DUF1993 domain-containing protein n=1 Tax=Synechococcus sp. A15-60 TaxID=1050655 RepID=UPI000C366CF9|nr:DUF1993 domain-containing protein [Synechococcus sp. A15-60]MAN20304.1 hypothetical protein [Synechococcus sp. EAC657]MEC7248929.1 DUF1993 domain-containing protein [Cyanobacteriota bacterium]MEC7896390.1 DUF1993 domain-containing protein [Cyanobacteriota bacterium]QNI47959.1 conserved hypothetical protein (DUF1993) [Synechococcus sp. A15-60]
MSTDLHSLVIPQLERVLTNLRDILERASLDLEQRQIPESVLLSSRLYPDMFDLQQQVQAATDIARRGTARLIGEEPSSMPDSEASFMGLINRVDSTLCALRALPAEAFLGGEQRAVIMPIPSSFGGGQLEFKALEFFTDFLLPNVYFHCSMAYAILRHNGTAIGKADFLGMKST